MQYLKQVIFGLLLSVILMSCNFDPKERFAKKQQIGTCQENDGMVTFEVLLYSDSTFYIPSTQILDYSFGKFTIRGENILFETEGGETHMCEKYLYIRKADTIKPILCSEKNSESLFIFFD